MKCDFEGCEEESCASTNVWLETGGLLAKYWCKNHAPSGEKLDWHCWAKAMITKCCPTCELGKVSS